MTAPRKVTTADLFSGLFKGALERVAVDESAPAVLRDAFAAMQAELCGGARESRDADVEGEGEDVF